jgi:general secretion pathway protein D
LRSVAEGKIRRSNTKSGNRFLAALFTFLFASQELFAAEMQPLPPVTIPPAVAVPPEVQPPTTSVPPPAAAPVPPPAVTPAPAVPAAPAAPPPLLAAPTEAPPPIPTTVPPETVPQVSQPLRPVPPETIAQTQRKIEEEGIYFNVADEDLREVIKQISRALGKNFILDDKVRGKITIISERKMTKDEIWEAFQSALDVNGFTIVQGPAGLLRLVPIRDALGHPIDLYSDESPFTDRFITRLITLKNISAADMANVIKGLVSKEGNLFAYPVTNTLILTDSGTNIDRLVRLINELDQEGPQEVLEIIPVLHANAKDIASKITQIFETEKGGAPAATPAVTPRRGAAAPTAELQEIPRLRKVIPDDRTNSLIVLASKMAIQKVRELIKKLDSPLVGEEGEVHVYYLKHAKAKDLATVLNAIAGAVTKDKDKDKKGTAAGTTAEAAKTAPSPAATLLGGAEFAGKFTVTADEATNALIITAGFKDFNTLVDQVILKLDIPRRQVYVEAVIVELSVSEDQQLGAGLLGGKTFNVGGNDLTAFGSTFGFLDVNRLLSGTVGAANTSDTITINTPGTPGSTGTNSITVPAFFSAIQFAQGNTDVNILSTPNILTLDNQEAEIKVGQKVPFPTASATTIGGSLQTTFTREDVALTLKIKPQINEGGAILMEVTQEDREVLPQQEQPSIAAQAGPSTTERSVKTAIVAQDGQTLVLGGLIKDKYTMVTNKVPLLGDIPLFGYLFKTRRKTKQKVNLLVFMTPHVIREPRDFLKILQKKINEQNNFISENFGKSQQKQIRKSLETHAAHLLEFTGEIPPAPLTDEERFPMEISPSETPESSSPTP